MPHRASLLRRLTTTTVAVLLAALATGSAGAQVAAVAGVAAPRRAVPLSDVARRRYVGWYAIDGAAGGAPMPLHVYEAAGGLVGRLRTNDPSPLIPLGHDAFGVSGAAGVTVRFTVVGAHATRVSIVAPDGTMHGVRTEAPAAAPDPATSGALFDELARMDSLLFDAAYVTCDAARTNAFLADDVEFYHDKSGFHQGAQVRADFERLARDCPKARGIVRELVPGSLHVYPISEYGAVQVGEHRFVERGAPSGTNARFVHLWRKGAGGWTLTRVLSYDHQPEAPR